MKHYFLRPIKSLIGESTYAVFELRARNASPRKVATQLRICRNRIRSKSWRFNSCLAATFVTIRLLPFERVRNRFNLDTNSGIVFDRIERVQDFSFPLRIVYYA